MKPLSTSLALLSVPSLAWWASDAAEQQASDVQNANHIFNAIHSSMRQFGSSLNHNGMSAFVATVPGDTEFYHGTSHPYRINGTEWLAFEPEHAYMFARAHGPGGGGRGPPPPYGPHVLVPGRSDDDELVPVPAFLGHTEDKQSHDPWKHSGSSRYGEHDGEDKQHGPPGRDDRHHSPPSSKHDDEDDCRAHDRTRPYPLDSHGRHDKTRAYEDKEQHDKEPKDKNDDRSRDHHAQQHDEERGHGKSRKHGAVDRFRDHHDYDGPDRWEKPRKHGILGGLIEMLHIAGHERHSEPRKHCDEPQHERYDDVEPRKSRGEGRHEDRPEQALLYEEDPSHTEQAFRHERRPHGDGHDSHDETDRKNYAMTGKPHEAEREHHSGFEYSADEHDFHHGLNTPEIQEPLSPGPGAEDEAHGYFHTYRTKCDLRLLYLDGQSAAKSNLGTLDMQDMVLLHHDPPGQKAHSGVDDEPNHHGPMGEGARAEGLCRMAQDEFQGTIDGFLRMEGGFEIILCDFAKHLDVVQIAQAVDSGEGGPRGHDNADRLNSLKAVAARYDGIGGDRVTLDYDHFVTLFAHPDALYFDDRDRPRVLNESAPIDAVREAITDMVLVADHPSRNWQAIADMLVTRYAERISHLASGPFEDLDEFRAEIGRALRPFIDFANRDTDHEIERCAAQFLPRERTTLAAQTLFHVSSVLCRTLVMAEKDESLQHGMKKFQQLKQWLAWTEWKKCRGCADHEVCFVPIWPMGAEEDFEHPQCRSDLSEAHGGYWGGFGPHATAMGGKPGPRRAV